MLFLWKANQQYCNVWCSSTADYCNLKHETCDKNLSFMHKTSTTSFKYPATVTVFSWTLQAVRNILVLKWDECLFLSSIYSTLFCNFPIIVFLYYFISLDSLQLGSQTYRSFGSTSSSFFLNSLFFAMQ